MPDPYPAEFHEDVVRAARTCGPGVAIEQVAADFGVHAMTLWKWMGRADIDDGTETGTNNQESAELLEARRRIKLPKQENEVLRRAAALTVAGTPSGKRIYPVVKELALGGVTVSRPGPSSSPADLTIADSISRCPCRIRRGVPRERPVRCRP